MPDVTPDKYGLSNTPSECPSSILYHASMSTTPTSNNAPSRKAAWKSNRPSWMRKGSLATHASHSVSSIVLPSSALTTLSYRTPADGVVVGQSPLATSSNTTSNAVPASASSGPQPNLALRHALETHIRSLPEVERTAYLTAFSMDPGSLLDRGQGARQATSTELKGQALD